MKKIYLIILALTLGTGLQAQSTFHKSFALAGNGGILYRTHQTSDGGFVSVGRISSSSMFEGDFLIMKTDASGNASWIKKCATADFEEFTDVEEVANGGLVAVGTSSDMNTFISTAVVEKFSADGIRQWCKTYGISGHSAGARMICKDAAGNLYVLGTVATDATSDDYFIMKLDAGGNILSQTTFSTPDSDYPLGFLRKGNGDFFICGWDNTFNGENIHLLKINADMTLAWNKLITGTIRYFAYDMQERSDGDLVLAGRFDDNTTSYDILICTLDDSNGEQVWAKSYSANEGFGTYAYGLTIGSGDAITVTGPAETADKGTFLLSTDAAGNINWSNRYGAPGSTGEGYGVTTASDGGYVVCGLYSGSNDEIVQLLKTNSGGYLPCNTDTYGLSASSLTLPMQTIMVTVGTPSLAAQDHVPGEAPYSTLGTICLETGMSGLTETTITVSPNPSDGRFTLTVPGTYAGAKVTVVNAAGIELMQDSLPFGNGLPVISSPFSLSVPGGIYFVKIDDGIHQATRKILINR